MSGALTVGNVPELLKYIWDEEVFDYQYEDAAYYAMVEKDTSWEGLFQIVTVKTAHAGSRSGKFASAKKNKRAGKFNKMQIESQDSFALWSVDNKLITLTRSRKGSLANALADATQDAQTRFKRATCWQLWGNGGGAIGKIAVGGRSGADCTLDNPDNIRNFEIGDVIEFALDDGVNGDTGPAGVLSGTLTVLDLDEDEGIIVFDDNLSTIVGLNDGAFLFQEGDYAAVIHGVPAYVTLQDPGTGDVPTSIHGMDRSSFKTRLAGSRFTGQQLLIQEEIKNALTTARRRNIKTTHLFMAPEVLNDLEMSLEGAKRYADEKIGRVGFSGIEFLTQNGQSVKCFGDADIGLGPNGGRMIFGLNLPTFKLHTAEEWPMWLTADGEKKFLTEENANAREGRIGGYGEHYTNAAGQNWNLELQDAA